MDAERKLQEQAPPAPAPASVPGRPLAVVLGEAGLGSAQQRTHDCESPIRLRGSKELVDKQTGEVRIVYSSEDELDGSTWVPCGNRRASQCKPCSTVYKGDAWQLITAGLAGGKGIPVAVSDHPCTFATFTAPSFGAVHGVRQKGPCRARRDKPVCPHGHPLWCSVRHGDNDQRLGTPLCLDCYDYPAHVVWQFHSTELWRRFTIALQRDLAQRCDLSVERFRSRCKISFAKIVEFQQRGVIHLHVPIRLDGANGPDGPAPDLPLTAEDLEDAIRGTAGRMRMRSAPLRNGHVYELRWGNQVDCRTISGSADRDGRARSYAVRPEQVASYLAKYLTKTTEDLGLPSRVKSSRHAALAGASDHAVRILEAAECLADQGDDYQMLLSHLGMLGYRGHPITKSRAYSVTFGQLRRARRLFRHKPAGLAPDADVRQLLDDDQDVPEGFVLVSSWVFLGQGYLDLDQASAAVRSAQQSRMRAIRRAA
jgi:hypothetical protein